MQPQKLCLKWHSHTANLLSVLGGFQQRDILVDVTISCEGQNIKAHKMVLSACSPYFQNIFLENPCQHPVVIINGMKYEDIAAILNFMYKGEVNISQDGLASFLQAAEALKVKGLAEKDCEKKSTNSSSQEVQQTESQNRPQRTETPPRKRHRRKRSLSDSNRSDDEGSSRKQHREPSSPEVHELSGDESFTGDTNSNGPPFNSVPRVPQNVYSRSHQSSSNLGDDDDEFEVEPSKLLEQNMTTDSVSMNNSSAEKGLRIERIMGNADLESSSLQEPESPPDIKPIIDYGDSSAGPSETGMMLYNEQSQPGPSSLQDGSLQLHDNAHTQDNFGKEAKPSEWNQSARKIVQLKGEYKESKGRKVGEPCGCARLKCFDFISKDEQTDIFRRFQEIPNKVDQDYYIQTLIDMRDVQRRRPRKSEGARQVEKVFTYHVLVGIERREVCFKAFLSLLGISDERVKRLRRLAMLGQSPYDKRRKSRKDSSSSREVLPADVQQMMVQRYLVSE